MAPSSARSSAAQPCTSPIANTLSPPNANGAGLQSEISTGRSRVVSMSAMVDLTGLPLHRGRRAALELFLDGSIEVEEHGGHVLARHPEMGGEREVVVGQGLDADVGD